MAVTDLKYAERICYIDKFNEKTYSSYTYRQASEDYALMASYHSPFALQLTGSASIFNEIKLIEYANGNYVRFKYSLYTNEYMTIYYIHYEMALMDKNDNMVQNGGSFDTTVSWADAPTYVTIPFSECYYVPSFIQYSDGFNNTVANDPAVSAQLMGTVYYKKPERPTLGYIDFEGTHKTNEIAGSYNNLVAGYFVSDDNSYNQYNNAADQAGDGTQWREKGSPTPAPDPSGPGGGDRPSDDGGVAIDFPTLPSVSIIETGFLTLYCPSSSQLQALATKLWSSDFAQTIEKILNDPFDGIIGLNMIPFTPTTSGTENCMIGNYDSEVVMNLVSAQYYTLDCGTITVAENWGNALDYNSTSIEIFIPFVGFRTLNIQDCMGRTLALKYFVDILSGSGVAILKCGDKCLYEWPCNVSYTVPLTGSNKSALYTGLINIALSGAGGMAAGGAMGAVGGAATSAINVATHSQSNIQRSGSVTANTGFLGDFTPYIVLHRPKQSMPSNFKGIKGYQSNITAVLGTCRGYTEVDYVHLTGISGATDTELNEIERLLKEGVLI